MDEAILLVDGGDSPRGRVDSPLGQGTILLVDEAIHLVDEAIHLVDEENEAWDAVAVNRRCPRFPASLTPQPPLPQGERGSSRHVRHPSPFMGEGPGVRGAVSCADS